MPPVGTEPEGPAGAPQGSASGLLGAHRVRRRRRKVPTILQLESVECGAAALAMVLASYDIWLPLEELRTACSVSRDGANALNIVRAARAYGLEADGFRRELAELPGEPFPVIAHWGFKHFVVVEGVSRKGLYVNDPAAGRRVVPWEEADRSFTGIVLRFAPTPQLERRGRAPSAMRSLVPLTAGSRLAILFAVLAGLALLPPALALPLVPKLYLDTVVAGGAKNWAYAIALALGIAMLVQWYFLRLQQLVALRFNVKLGLLLGNRLVAHALRLPQTFFEQRSAGDVAYRVALAGQVAATLSGQVAPALLGGVVSLAYLALLAVLSLPLAGIAVAGGLVEALALWLARRRRRELSLRVTKHVTAFNSTVAYGLRTIETVKASGSEVDLFGSVTGLNARVLSAWISFERPTVALAAMPGFVAHAVIVAALGVGALLALDGQLSLGALLAAMVALGGFSSPIGTIVNLATAGQQLRANLARMEDLENQAEDRVLTAPPPFEPTSNGEPAGASARPRAKLRGELELRGVTFGYDLSTGPLLENFDLRLRPGSRVAVVGATGSGKSTVAKLVTGLLVPWQGEVLLDGRPYLDWPRETVTNSLAMVSQDIVLFAGTVRENLTLWDRSISEEDVVAAARDAAIHDTIIARPGDYDATIHEAGGNWSGGEGQRLEIARALATRPAIVVLDEATSALDPIVELEIVQSLRRRGVTMLVVAHRLSTVRDADEILVLDRGRVAERGTHEELIEAGGRYRELVAAE